LTVTEEGEPYFRDEPWHRERIRQSRYEHVGRTLLVGGEATFRTDVESLEDIALHHVSF
jgi:hypothetical protein